MIAVDTNILIYYLEGKDGYFSEKVDDAILSEKLYLAPVVVTELLSEPNLNEMCEDIINRQPVLAIKEGYWQRAGKLRRTLLEKGLKARLPDVLIAQSCIDWQVPLISSDTDFRHFQEYTSLELIHD